MKIIPSIDQIKDFSDMVTLPAIDVKPKVMENIYRRKEKNSMFKSKKLLLCVVTSVILICTVGFTILKTWELSGPGGSYKYSLFESSSSDNSKLVKSQWDKVQPGGALAIMQTKNPSQNKVKIYPKPIVLTTINDAKEKIGESFKEPSYLPEGYKYSNCDINASLPSSLHDEIMAEAKDSKEDVIVKIIKPSDDTGSYTLTYKSNDKIIDVSLSFNWIQAELSQPDHGQKVSKIAINNFEAIYTDGNGRKEIKWIDTTNGVNTLYSVGCPESSTSKEELIKVANSLK